MPIIDRIYMSEALKEAKKALEAGELPVGAVIVHHRQLLGRAHHQTRTLKDPTAHASMIAVTQAAGTLGSRFLKSATLYTTVKPCPMCAGAAALAGIDRVIYGVAPETPRKPAKIKSSAGVLRQDCAALLTAYKKYRRNRKRLLL